MLLDPCAVSYRRLIFPFRLTGDYLFRKEKTYHSLRHKKSKRVAAVVTASLVGALSIGATAVALAANANIDLQFAAGDEFAQGTLKNIKVDGVNVESKDTRPVSLPFSSTTEQTS